MPAEPRLPAAPAQPRASSAPVQHALSWPARMPPTMAADYLMAIWAVRRTPGTLRKLRCVGGGPQFRRAGRSVVYERAALDSWAAVLLGPVLAVTQPGRAHV